jgi:SulP family sulfate permease
MFVVVIATFEWSSFKTIGKVPFSDVWVIVVVTAMTVWHDLATAVFSGVVLSALVFAWKSSKNVRRTMLTDAEGARIYGLEGLLYFGSVRDFSEKFDPASDPDHVTLDFRDARVCDLSGLEAVRSLAERYRKAGKTLHVRHLSPDCRRMLERAGSLLDVQVADDDPAYLVARVGR